MSPEDDSFQDFENLGELTDDSLTKGYFSSVRLKLLFIILLAAVCIVVALFSLTVNHTGLDVFETIDVIIKHLSGATYEERTEEWFNDKYIWGNSLPRLLFTILAGIGLAVAGAAMQSTMNNPLADPYTTGVSSGACLGLAVAIVLGLSINYGDIYLIIILAFFFALIPMIAIILLAPKTKASPSTLILAGVAISYLFNSANTFIMVAVDSETLSSIYAWQIGTLSTIRWANIPLSAISVIIGSGIILFLSRQLNLLSLGDASATSLGIDPDNLRIICLVSIAFIVGTIVGSAGIIGFVGLITPHMVRSVIGSDSRYVIPAAAVLSVTMMIIADMISRSIMDYDSVPVGAVLSLIGAPIFLYLIVRRKSRVW